MHDASRWVNRPESRGLNSYVFLMRKRALTWAYGERRGGAWG
ncbi:hypothetical protein SBD_6081 [Streptomyces bottropensis ATCC 25435]|uniref:Uncharacterized protein n=1 Tax=Streptomyces bottropensis ATCC 25435 TaxID=1054862 RepID=M3FLP9_9ACTN|nr:hypothetical protein SBD_6081 [Streptomyces bottropensis ATCC 25435]